LRLDYARYSGLSGSNRAGKYYERFITPLGSNIQGASFKIMKDEATGQSIYLETYKIEPGTSQATPLVTSRIASKQIKKIK